LHSYFNEAAVHLDDPNNPPINTSYMVDDNGVFWYVSYLVWTIYRCVWSVVLERKRDPSSEQQPSLRLRDFKNQDEIHIIWDNARSDDWL